MPSCETCGRQIAAGQQCSECALADHQDSRDRQVDWGECPDCGGLSSSNDVRCASCRTGGTDE